MIIRGRRSKAVNRHEISEQAHGIEEDRRPRVESLRNALLALADLKLKGNLLGSIPNIENISEYL